MALNSCVSGSYEPCITNIESLDGSDLEVIDRVVDLYGYPYQHVAFRAPSNGVYRIRLTFERPVGYGNWTFGWDREDGSAGYISIQTSFNTNSVELDVDVPAYILQQSGEELTSQEISTLTLGGFCQFSLPYYEFFVSSYTGLLPGHNITISGNLPNIIDEGQSITFNVDLTAQPDEDVEVSVNQDLSFFTTNVDSLIFTPDNWNVHQQFTVTSKIDNLITGNLNRMIRSSSRLVSRPLSSRGILNIGDTGTRISNITVRDIDPQDWDSTTTRGTHADIDTTVWTNPTYPGISIINIDHFNRVGYCLNSIYSVIYNNGSSAKHLWDARNITHAQQSVMDYWDRGITN